MKRSKHTEANIAISCLWLIKVSMHTGGVYSQAKVSLTGFPLLTESSPAPGTGEDTGMTRASMRAITDADEQHQIESLWKMAQEVPLSLQKGCDAVPRDTSLLHTLVSIMGTIMTWVKCSQSRKLTAVRMQSCTTLSYRKDCKHAKECNSFKNNLH